MTILACFTKTDFWNAFQLLNIKLIQEIMEQGCWDQSQLWQSNSPFLYMLCIKGQRTQIIHLFHWFTSLVC